MHIILYVKKILFLLITNFNNYFMKKLKLFIAALALLGGVNLANAQTNIIAGWDGGDDTSSPSNFGWTSSANRTLNARNASSGIRMTTTYSGYKLENGTSYSYSASSDPSSVIFWVRYNTSGESFTYTFQGLEADTYYDFSGLVGWHNNQSAPTLTVVLNDGTNTLATMSKTASTKQTLYSISSRFKTPSTITNTTDIKIVFTCNQTGDCMEAISALSLVQVVVKDELQAVLTYANRVNTQLNNSTLASAITTAQEIYDNASATQAQVNEAIPTLKAAVAAAISEDSPSDISWVLANPGFEGCAVTTTNAAATGNAAPLDIAGEWTQSSSAAWSSSAVVAYGGAGQVNGASAPSTDDASNSGNTLGVSVGWDGLVTYQSPAILLPAGVYTLQVKGYNANTATQFASKFGFVPTSGDATLSTKSSFTASTWETDEVTFTLNADTEGKIQVGGQAVSGGSGSNAKVFFDNITIGYESPLAGAARLFNEKIDEAKAITSPHEASVKSALAEAITTAEAVSATTVEEYETAKAALQTAIDNSTTSINHYQNDLRPVIDKLKNYATDDLSAMDNDYNNGVYTSETDKAALISQYQTIEIAALQAANATDYTSAIINPDFEFDAAAISIPTGWSRTNNAKENGTRNTAVTNMSGWYYNTYQEWWDTNIDIKQTITGLPNGEYEIGATLAGWSGCTVNLTANSDFSYINGAGDGTGVATTVATFVTDGTLNIKVNWGVRDGENKGTFFKCDNFTLTYNGIKPMLEDAITSANAIKSSNVGSEAFQIPSAAQSTFNAAISTAQGVYDNSNATPSEVQTAIDNLNTAKEEYVNATINAPASDVQYRIKSTAAEAAGWKDKYYVLKKDDSQTNGGYSTRAEGTDATYLATAWKFTSVSGNTYKLSMIDANGAERYLCTNITGYGDGSATQIRTTTDDSKALAVKIIAATGTEGRWYLQNTEDNSYLGGQDAGLYSNSQNYDLAIEAAEMASIDVNIGETVKYATRIFPFAPTLPEGVKAYSAAVDVDKVTLTEATTLAANTPYILFANEGYNGDALSGWGTASATSYTSEVLTGVYEDTPAPDDSYVLAQINNKVCFYQVDNDDKPKVTPYRCYLTAPSASRVLLFDNEYTGIDAINALTSGEAIIFNASGVKVPSLQKGMNIVRMKNGKTQKIMVK